MKMNKNLATVLQVVGIAAATIGVFLWSIPAGLIVGGLAVTLIGVSLGMNE
jgi:hypothetical protein